jgi:hypothetical protein
MTALSVIAIAVHCRFESALSECSVFLFPVNDFGASNIHAPFT